MDSIKEQRIKELEHLKVEFRKNISGLQKEIGELEKRITKCDEEIVILNTDRK